MQADSLLTELQGNSIYIYIYIYIERERERERERETDLLQQLTCVVMEAKSPIVLAFCKLENQESQWYNSAGVQRPENQRS